jgi:hypothetical protein
MPPAGTEPGYPSEGRLEDRGHEIGAFTSSSTSLCYILKAFVNARYKRKLILKLQVFLDILKDVFGNASKTQLQTKPH